MTTQVYTVIYNVHLDLYGQIRSNIPKNGIAKSPDVRWVALADATILPKGTKSNQIKCFIKSIHAIRKPPHHKIIHTAIPLDFHPSPDNILKL